MFFENFDFILLLFQSVSVKNFSYRLDLLPAIIPSGDYKAIWKMTSREEKSYGNITHVLSIKSTDRDSFG
jgi:hypothetical protein